MKRFIILCLLGIMLLVLGGCSGKEEVDFYKANMEQFFKNVETLDGLINDIDITKPDYSDTLLGYLDQLDKSFEQMSSLEVPKTFVGVKELAVDASENMSTAVQKYHLAYEGEEFDTTLEYEAFQNYSKANKELHYIIRILQGEKFEDVVGITEE